MRAPHGEREAPGISNMNCALRKGQRLRPLRPAVAEREWGVSGDAVGTVICAYRVAMDRLGAHDRVDVMFGPRKIVWGAPADEFALVPEVKSAKIEVH